MHSLAFRESYPAMSMKLKLHVPFDMLIPFLGSCPKEIKRAIFKVFFFFFLKMFTGDLFCGCFGFGSGRGQKTRHRVNAQPKRVGNDRTSYVLPMEYLINNEG